MEKQNIPVLNVECLLDVGDKDPEFIRDLIGDALNETPVLFEEFHQAFDSGIQDDIRVRAHKLRGSLANFGGERLVQIILELEEDIQNRKEFDPTRVNLELISGELENFKKALRDTDWEVLCNK